MTEPLAEGHQLPAIVPCADPHGGEVVSVLEIDAKPDAVYPASGRSIAGADAQVTKCGGSSVGGGGDVAAFVGSNVLAVTAAQTSATGVSQAWSVSGIQAATYVPGPAAWMHGARWFVCAGVLSNSLDVPSTYTGSIKGGRAKPGVLAEQFGWCKLQASGANRNDFQSVACTKPHNYEQLVSFLAGTDATAYPADATLDKVATSLCAPLSSEATAGRSDHLTPGIELGWTYPLESEWAAGDRSVRCYAVTVKGSSVGTVGMGTAELVK